MDERTENKEPDAVSTSMQTWLIVAFVSTLSAASAIWFFDDPIQERAAAIATVCLVLWLSEAVPAYVPTLILWALTATLLGPLSKNYALGEILKWSANPILLLFFGGFAFGVAASRYNVDLLLARQAVRLSRRKRFLLVTLTVGMTAFMSMWLSNIAAAAMMIAALHPITAKLGIDDRFRRALLIAVAIGANFGGIATPIGTGPNAIAISALERVHHMTFAGWMSFALPLTVGLLLVGTVLIRIIYDVKGDFDPNRFDAPKLDSKGRAVVALFAAAIILWLSEPIHGVPAAVVALASSAILFGSGLLSRRDLNSIDWGTIALIAGGVSLGSLLESAGLIEFFANRINWSSLPLTIQILILCFASAMLAALMSNTATVTLLIPFAAAVMPNPSIAVLVAVAASLGIPFTISTPINAMVYGEGGIRARDFIVIGVPLMIGGCLLLALTGSYFLSFWFGP